MVVLWLRTAKQEFYYPPKFLSKSSLNFRTNPTPARTISIVFNVIFPKPKREEKISHTKRIIIIVENPKTPPFNGLNK